MNFFEEVAIDDSSLKVNDRKCFFLVAVDVKRKIIKINPYIINFYEFVRDFVSKLKAEKFYADKAPWLIKGITSAGKTYIHQTFGKRSYVERVILEIKQLRKFRRSFQNAKSFRLNLKGFEVFYNFFRFHQSLKDIPASSIKT